MLTNELHSCKLHLLQNLSTLASLRAKDCVHMPSLKRKLQEGEKEHIVEKALLAFFFLYSDMFV